MSLLLLSGLALAHNPALATFTLTEERGAWGLRLETSQAAFDAAVGESASEEEIVAYVKRTVHIEADHQPLSLGRGAIQAGEHVSALTFALPQLSDEVHSLKIRLDTFAENPAQTNLLRLDREGERQKWALTPGNDFSAELPLRPPEPGSQATLAGGVLVLAALGLALGR